MSLVFLRDNKLYVSSFVFFTMLLVGLGWAIMGRAAGQITITSTSSNVDVAPNTFRPGDTVTYRVTVSNDTSTGALEDINYVFRVLDPNGNHPETASIAGEIPEGFTLDATGKFITSVNRTLAEGASTSFDVTVDIPSNYSAPTLNVTATVSGTIFMREARNTMNLYAPFITLSQNVPSAVPPGNFMLYQITVANNGYAPATNVTVTDIPSPFASYISAIGADDCVAGTNSSHQAIVVCGPFTLNSASSAGSQRTIVLKFSAPLASCPLQSNIQMTNNVSVTADGVAPTSAIPATTNVACPTPTPSPIVSTPVPIVPTPSPRIVYVATSSSSIDSSGSSSSEGNSSSVSAIKKVVAKKGKVLGVKTPPKVIPVGYIPYQSAPLYVDYVFRGVFGRKPVKIESSYWKVRARNDKDTIRLLANTMMWHRAKGRTYAVLPK